MRRVVLPTGTGGPMGWLLGVRGLTIFLEELPRESVHLERRYRYARGADGRPIFGSAGEGQLAAVRAAAAFNSTSWNSREITGLPW